MLMPCKQQNESEVTVSWEIDRNDFIVVVFVFAKAGPVPVSQG